jgi:glycosyltransferase involved in cell wall biosynthesis
MLSVVIPIFNEVENVPELHAELQDVLTTYGRAYEIIYVDDGSSDGSLEELCVLADRHPEVRVIQFRRNFGQTAALAAGIDGAVGDILIFMDGDLQNDPHDIPRLVSMLEDEGYDVVSGWRKNRQDAAINRKLPSRLANRLISVVSGVHLNDYGCTLKAYRREVIENVRLYGEMHRFIPAYAAWGGAKIGELAVNHRARKYGRSKYGINRTVKVLLDLATLKFLSDWSTKPLQLFGGLGMLCWAVALFCILVVGYMRFFEDVRAHRNPILLIAILLILSGLLLITQGLQAELITRTYHESQNKRPYVIRREFGRGASTSDANRATTGERKPEPVAAAPPSPNDESRSAG